MSPDSMSKTLAAVALASLVASPMAGADTTVVECVEPDGSVTFRTTCPPGSVEKGRRVVDTAPSAADQRARAAADHPVTFYSVADCEACDLVRLTLDRLGIPYDEVDVAADADAQATLNDRLGKIRAPVTLVGDTAVPGYDRAGLEAALTEAGYDVGGGS